MPVHIVCVWFSYWKLAWKHISNAIQYEHTLERSYRFFIVPACTRLHCRARCFAWTVCWALFRNLATSESQPMECALVLWLHLKCFVSKVALLLFIYLFFLFLNELRKNKFPSAYVLVWFENITGIPYQSEWILYVRKKNTHTKSRGSFVWQQCTLYVYDYQIVLKITTALHGQWYKVAFQF